MIFGKLIESFDRFHCISILLEVYLSLYFYVDIFMNSPNPFNFFFPLSHHLSYCIKFCKIFLPLKDIHLLFNFSFFHLSGSYEAIQKVRIHEALLHLTGGSIQQVNLTQDTKLSEKGRDMYDKFICNVN